jgi:RimJ/RimL family protein N-acetyltransferase
METERLVIRCWDLRDAALLKEAIDSSLDHLRPRMPWAQKEPEDLNAKVERLRKWISQFENGQDFFYGIFSRNETRVIGGTGLHTRR